MNNAPLITKRILRAEDRLRVAHRSLQYLNEAPDNEMARQLRPHVEEQVRIAESAHDWLMERTPLSIDFDAPPIEVATEMLCDNRARLTARQRKTFMAARETRYIARFPESTPGTTKLASRFESAKLSQLGKWLRRALHLNMKLRKAAKRAETLSNETMRTNALSAINLRLVNVEITKTLLQSELHNRMGKSSNPKT